MHKLDQLDPSDVSTILVALRLFQRTYAEKDAEEIFKEWPNRFSNGRIQPLSTDDIDALCLRIEQVQL